MSRGIKSFKVEIQGVPSRNFVRGLAALNKKSVVVRVRGNVVIGAAERARQKLATTFEGAGALALVVPKGLMTFEKKFFVMTADALE